MVSTGAFKRGTAVQESVALRRAAPLRPAQPVVWLAVLIAVLSAIAAGVGLLWRDERDPVPFTTLHGQVVQLYGQGLYRHDTLLNGPGYKGMDLFILVVGVPLLAVGTLLY